MVFPSVVWSCKGGFDGGAGKEDECEDAEDGAEGDAQTGHAGGDVAEDDATAAAERTCGKEAHDGAGPDEEGEASTHGH